MALTLEDITRTSLQPSEAHSFGLQPAEVTVDTTIYRVRSVVRVSADEVALILIGGAEDTMMAVEVFSALTAFSAESILLDLNIDGDLIDKMDPRAVARTVNVTAWVRDTNERYPLTEVGTVFGFHGYVANAPLTAGRSK